MGLIDETRDHDEQPINEIVLPLLNVSRRLPDNTVNEKEPNQQRIFIEKICFSWDFDKIYVWNNIKLTEEEKQKVVQLYCEI